MPFVITDDGTMEKGRGYGCAKKKSDFDSPRILGKNGFGVLFYLFYGYIFSILVIIL